MCDQATRLPLIGERAPEFEAETTQGTIHFPKDYEGKWVVFFSHPADFTPVCTTEFMTFASMADEFKELNCELLGLSIDSTYSHIAWLRTIKEKIEYKGMKDIEVDFPVISDLTMEVSKAFGMLQTSASTTSARKGTKRSGPPLLRPGRPVQPAGPAIDDLTAPTGKKKIDSPPALPKRVGNKKSVRFSH